MVLLILSGFVSKVTVAPEIYTYCNTLSQHGALPISVQRALREAVKKIGLARGALHTPHMTLLYDRSEEHTSELQSLIRISYAVTSLKKKENPYLSYCYCI